jgi:hypothetical protein
MFGNPFQLLIVDDVASTTKTTILDDCVATNRPSFKPEYGDLINELGHSNVVNKKGERPKERGGRSSAHDFVVMAADTAEDDADDASADENDNDNRHHERATTNGITVRRKHMTKEVVTRGICANRGCNNKSRQKFCVPCHRRHKSAMSPCLTCQHPCLGKYCYKCRQAYVKTLSKCKKCRKPAGHILCRQCYLSQPMCSLPGCLRRVTYDDMCGQCYDESKQQSLKNQQ